MEVFEQITVTVPIYLSDRQLRVQWKVHEQSNTESVDMCHGEHGPRSCVSDVLFVKVDDIVEANAEVPLQTCRRPRTCHKVEGILRGTGRDVLRSNGIPVICVQLEGSN